MRLHLLFIPVFLLFCISTFSQGTSATPPETAQNNQDNTKKLYKLKEVDYAPIFSKGKMSQKDFLKIYLKYPPEAKEKGIEGTVILSFVVNPDGEVTSQSILQGDHAMLNQEAIRIASLIPYYTPGYFNDVPVATQILFPITFTIEESASSLPPTPAATAIPQDSVSTDYPIIPESVALQATNADGSPAPIYIIDGKMIDSSIDLDANKIESIRVIKGKKALQLYGQGAKDGVVIITTKLYPDTK